MEKFALPTDRPGLRIAHIEPLHPIDLGESFPYTAARGPFHLERIASLIGRIEITLDRPGMDLLSAPLCDRSQLDRLSGGGRRPDLLGEFPQGGLEGIFPRIDRTFRDRPRTFILTGPERSTHMPKQHL